MQDLASCFIAWCLHMFVGRSSYLLKPWGCYTSPFNSWYFPLGDVTKESILLSVHMISLNKQLFPLMLFESFRHDMSPLTLCVAEAGVYENLVYSQSHNIRCSAGYKQKFKALTHCSGGTLQHYRHQFPALITLHFLLPCTLSGYFCTSHKICTFPISTAVVNIRRWNHTIYMPMSLTSLYLANAMHCNNLHGVPAKHRSNAVHCQGAS